VYLVFEFHLMMIDGAFYFTIYLQTNVDQMTRCSFKVCLFPMFI